MVSRELFGEYVKAALVNLHDPVRLQTSPLAELLPLPETGEMATARLRALLRETVEALRPDAAIPTDRPEWLGYRLLSLRYLRSFGVQRACQELGLSLASFYRHHQEALEAVTSLLWERYQQAGAGAKVEAKATNALQASAEASRVAREAHRQPVDLRAVLADARGMLQPLLQQRGLSWEIHCPDVLPLTYGDPALLRQVLLNILGEALQAAQDKLELTVQVRRGETLWRVADLARAQAGEMDLAQAPGMEIGRSLLQAYGGRVWVEERPTGRRDVCFTLPVGKPPVVLIIEDDADTVRLYQAYLQAHDYVVRTARSAAQLRAQLAEELPDIILLDVLMPREDGWDILRHLKGSPASAEIPVVICSVLSQPALALSLGAAEVLLKPISEEALLRTIERILRRKDNPE